ncbi:MAG: thioredoxin domain-containing protein [Acidobacteriota bacterium]|nr:thioredoxin domain-containing protein [Acidobacteriota bacterium]
MEGKKIKVSCLNCGQTNYYPEESGEKKVVCGKCRSPLPGPGKDLEVNPAQVLNLISRSSLPVLVDFFSPSCRPCQMMAPMLGRLAKRRAGEIMVIKVDIDKYPDLASQFGIQAVPTLIVFHRQTERGRTSGVLPETDLALWVAKLA